ncbi:hypothetical protein MKW98_008623, partial [Papaver atlanticum]
RFPLQRQIISCLVFIIVPDGNEARKPSGLVGIIYHRIGVKLAYFIIMLHDRKAVHFVASC